MWKDIIVPMGCALIGAISALAGVLLTNRGASRQRKSEWFREQKYKVYIGLVGILENIGLDIVVPEDASIEKLEFNVDELTKQLEVINNYLEDNRAMMFFFLPQGVYGDIIRLQAKVYRIISNPELQVTPLEKIIESALWEAILDAKKITNKLKKDIFEN